MHLLNEIFKMQFPGTRLHDFVPTSMATVLLSISTNTFCGLWWALHRALLLKRSVHPASPVLLTKNAPHGTCIQCETPIKRVTLLTNLKFENRFEVPDSSNHSLYQIKSPPPEFPLASTSLYFNFFYHFSTFLSFLYISFRPKDRYFSLAMDYPRAQTD